MRWRRDCGFLNAMLNEEHPSQTLALSCCVELAKHTNNLTRSLGIRIIHYQQHFDGSARYQHSRRTSCATLPVLGSSV